MKKVYLIVTTLLLLCACGEDIETEEERLVYDPYDAKPFNMVARPIRLHLLLQRPSSIVKTCVQ